MTEKLFDGAEGLTKIKNVLNKMSKTEDYNELQLVRPKAVTKQRKGKAHCGPITCMNIKQILRMSDEAIGRLSMTSVERDGLGLKKMTNSEVQAFRETVYQEIQAMVDG